MAEQRRKEFPSIQLPPAAATQGPQRILPRQIPTGTGRGQQAVGDKNIRIEYDNRRIIINDGENDRVLIGFDSGGF